MLSSTLTLFGVSNLLGMIVNGASVLVCSIHWTNHGDVHLQIYYKDYIWHSLLILLLFLSMILFIIIFSLSCSNVNEEPTQRKRITIFLICICLFLVMLSTAVEIACLTNKDNYHNDMHQRIIAVLILTIILNIILIMLIVIIALNCDRNRVNDLATVHTPYPSELTLTRSYSYQQQQTHQDHPFFDKTTN